MLTEGRGSYLTEVFIENRQISQMVDWARKLDKSKLTAEYRQRLAGKIYELLCYDEINQDKQSYRRYLLTPSQTAQYYRRNFFPDQKVSNSKFGLSGIYGKIIPDGIMFDREWNDLFYDPQNTEGWMTRVYEYTMRKGDDLIFRALQQRHTFDQMREAYPDNFAVSQLIFVLPMPYKKEDQDDLKKLKAITNYKLMPFSRLQFGKQLNSLIG
jgi:hypothetical protein